MNWSFPKWELRVGRSEFLAQDDYIPIILRSCFKVPSQHFYDLNTLMYTVLSCILYSLCLFFFMPSPFYFLSPLFLRMKEFSLQQGTCSRVRKKPPERSRPRTEEPGALLSWGLWSKGTRRCVFELCKRVWAYNFGRNDKKLNYCLVNILDKERIMVGEEEERDKGWGRKGQRERKRWEKRKKRKKGEGRR